MSKLNRKERRRRLQGKKGNGIESPTIRCENCDAATVIADGSLAATYPSADETDEADWGFLCPKCYAVKEGLGLVETRLNLNASE